MKHQIIAVLLVFVLFLGVMPISNAAIVNTEEATIEQFSKYITAADQSRMDKHNEKEPLRSSDAAPLGADLSWFNGTVDWDLLAPEIDFAILRAGYTGNGANFALEKDSKYASNAAGCAAQGLPFGVYYYGGAKTAEQARTEAECLLEWLGAENLPTLPIFYEVYESNNLLKLDNETLLEVVTAFCTVIEEAGYRAGVYAATYVWNTKLTDPAYENWVRWTAQRGTSAMTVNAGVNLWQFTNEARLPGVDTTVQLDYWLGELGNTSHPSRANITPPSCTEDGQLTCTCVTHADETITYRLPANGHYWSDETITIEPSCTEEGYSYHPCLRCGEQSKFDFVSPLGHAFGDWEEISSPTCTNSGIESRTCSQCGLKETRESCPALGHSFSEPNWQWSQNKEHAYLKFICTVCSVQLTINAQVITTTTDATCTVDGIITRTASANYNGLTYTDIKEFIIPAQGHDFSEWTVSQQPTCTEPGVYMRSCSRCDITETIVIDALNHDWSAWSIAATPTCATSGYSIRICNRCSAYETKSIDALGHVWDDGKITKPATTTEEGIKLFTCTRCGKTRKEKIPKTSSFTFDDVQDPTAYYYEAVYWAYNHKPYQVTAGIDKTHFGPNQTVTRAQAMTFFWAAKDRPKFKKASTQFVDVKKTDWYYKSVMWAVENGITAGTDATHFSPNKTCNRGEILAFLYAAMKKPKVKISNPYKDVSNQWYKKAAVWAYENRIEKGEKGRFNASTPCTRASTVTYLYRFIEGKSLLD